MKKAFYLVTVLVLGLAITSCSKDDSSVNSNGSDAGARAESLGFANAEVYEASVTEQCAAGNHENCDIQSDGSHEVCAYEGHSGKNSDGTAHNGTDHGAHDENGSSHDDGNHDGGNHNGENHNVQNPEVQDPEVQNPAVKNIDDLDPEVQDPEIQDHDNQNHDDENHDNQNHDTEEAHSNKH